MHFARTMWHTYDCQLNWWVDLEGKMSNWPKQQINSPSRANTDFCFKKKKKIHPVPQSLLTHWRGIPIKSPPIIHQFTYINCRRVFLRATKRAQATSSQGKRTAVPRKSARGVTSAVGTSWVSKKKKCINFSWHVMEPHCLSANIQVGNPKPTDPSGDPFASLSPSRRSLPLIW